MARTTRTPAGGAKKPVTGGAKPARPAAAKKPPARAAAPPAPPLADELAALRDLAADLGRELRAARAEAAGLREQFAALREERAAVVRDLDDRLGQMAEKVAAARKVIEQLPRQTEEARWRVEETVDRLREAGHAAHDDDPAGEGDGGPAEPRNRLGVTVDPGVVVAEVEPDSPAAAAGVAPGDVILAANGGEVHTGVELRDAVQGATGGVTLRVARGEVSREVALAPRAGDDAGGGNRLGLTVAPGVVVAEVVPGSPAEDAGLTAGDVIREAGGTAVAGGGELRDAIHALPDGAEVVLTVARGGEVREVKARLDAEETEGG